VDTERKNVLSAVFYLGAALAYLRFFALTDSGDPGRVRWRYHAGALVLFVAALLVRNAGGYRKTDIAFAEFLWADFFRHRVQIGPRPEDFEAAVREALPLAHRPAARHLPGFLP
jgi:hypothetical protein